MSSAFKCDRCGEYCDGFPVKTGSVRGVNTYFQGEIKIGHLQICATCIKGMLKWLWPHGHRIEAF